MSEVVGVDLGATTAPVARLRAGTRSCLARYGVRAGAVGAVLLARHESGES